MTIFSIIDWVSFCLLGLSAAYLFIFALASMLKRKDEIPAAHKLRRFVVLIPAYKADGIVEEAIASVMAQDYPADKIQTVVIADKFRSESIEQLSRLPITLLPVDFENSSKAKALNYAIDNITADAADIVVILDTDNVAAPDLLRLFNDTFECGSTAMQAHRKAKNLDTDTAVLDAVSEEINNSIFRRGHVALGLSSALIGSGMAFDFQWFRDNVKHLSSAGEDKELETLLLKEHIFIDYIEEAEVLDEKVRGSGNFYNQRRRWLAAQFYSLSRALKDLPSALISLNIDYCDKLIQWMMPPRILLLGGIFLFALSTTIFAAATSVKWWFLLLILLFALAFATPDYLMDKRLRKAIRKLPLIFLLMAGNIFRIKGATHKFIHTDHNEKTKK